MAKYRNQTRLLYYSYLKPFSLASILLALAAWSYLTEKSFAQIVPDNTLTVNSTVNLSGKSFIIEGGTTAGSNLFHSFQEFSLPARMEAFFNNGGNISNIITRITGDNISSIDGSLRSNGSANLLIINPNGLDFGAGASLNIGGSFLGSTANSVIFSDGSSFSATEANAPNAHPLLTINVPAGLQFGGNPGAIRVSGTGHNLTAGPPLFLPLQNLGSDSGLGVLPGKTLALVGGDLVLSGGILTAESGRIELGSVRESNVSINPVSSGWAFDYVFDYESANDRIANNQNPNKFGDIQMNSLAIANVSGVGSGSIRVRSRSLQLRDGSILLSQNLGSGQLGFGQLGSGQPGDIQVNVSEDIEFNGTSPNGIIRSGIFSDALGGSGGDIELATKRLVFQSGGAIAATNNDIDSGGNITLNASESIDMIGLSFVNPIVVSGISSLNFGSGTAGNLAISTERLTLERGGTLASAAFGSGNGGSLAIRASTIELIGINPIVIIPTAIASASIRNSEPGNLTIDTDSLSVRDGANISAGTIGSGNAGSITINATNFVEISGTHSQTINPSQIEASAIIRDRNFQEAFRLLPVPEGNSGNVTINTPVLRVLEGGLLNLRNDGSGNSGTLSINADSILLHESSGLTASTASGQGGNIILNANNSLIMRRNSFITAEAGGAGNGGNITINAEILAALENSDIEANALEGAGGNIAINSAGIFGTQFREAPTPNSDITASSQFGLEGSVTINNPEIDPSSGLVELPVAIGDRTDKVIVGCGVALGSSFTVTGRGGLPADPTAPMRGETIWEDTRRFEETQAGLALEAQAEKAAMPNPQLAQPDARDSSSLVEATGWKLNLDGTVELVAAREDRNARYLRLPSTCNTE